MAGVRFADVQFRPAEFLNLTSLTLEEFQVVVAPFEAAFQEHMAAWRLDGKPRTARRFTVYRTCPLATPAGRLFGLGESKANQWIPFLLPALLAALRALGDAPARSLAALAKRLGVSDGALGVAPLQEPSSVACQPLHPSPGRQPPFCS